MTARVLVNRLWQYHFGQGLVKTPNDFGKRGLPPTHPELLDHLATRFLQSGWSIKTIHRLILLSATYRQASSSESTAAPGSGLSAPAPSLAAVSAPSGVSSMKARTGATPHPLREPGQGQGAGVEALATDYASFQRRRLTAEELRDAILRVSGELDPAPGRGHPFPAATSWGFSQHGPFSAVYEHHQRSVYLMTQRLKRHPFLALFDGADPNTSTPDRRGTTVPTQALFFLNDPFVHAQAEKFAVRMRRAGADAAARVGLAYRLALGRLPSDTERREATEFLGAYRATLSAALPEQIELAAWSAFARVLFASNEFLSID